MSANKDIEFPRLVEATIDSKGNIWGWYIPKEVDDWLQRCMADKPDIILSDKETLWEIRHRQVPSHECWLHWFDKWFGQFRNNKE